VNENIKARERERERERERSSRECRKLVVASKQAASAGSVQRSCKIQ
jgi:hypothetical protein